VAPEAWSWAALGGRGAVAVRALSDEGDDPGLTNRVGPPVSEREATAESDMRSRRRSNRTSGAGVGRIGQVEQATAESNKRSRRWADWAGKGGIRWATARLENKGGGRAENKEKGISELKIGFLDLPRIWKFVEGDLGGILT
jgi:hypothetical protein